MFQIHAGNFVHPMATRFLVQLTTDDALCLRCEQYGKLMFSASIVDRDHLARRAVAYVLSQVPVPPGKSHRIIKRPYSFYIPYSFHTGSGIPLKWRRPFALDELRFLIGVVASLCGL